MRPSGAGDKFDTMAVAAGAQAQLGQLNHGGTRPYGPRLRRPRTRSAPAMRCTSFASALPVTASIAEPAEAFSMNAKLSVQKETRPGSFVVSFLAQVFLEHIDEQGVWFIALTFESRRDLNAGDVVPDIHLRG